MKHITWLSIGSDKNIQMLHCSKALRMRIACLTWLKFKIIFLAYTSVRSAPSSSRYLWAMSWERPTFIYPRIEKQWNFGIFNFSVCALRILFYIVTAPSIPKRHPHNFSRLCFYCYWTRCSGNWPLYPHISQTYTCTYVALSLRL